MKEFQFSDPSVLVSGPVIQTFLSALGPYQARGMKVVRRTFKVDDVLTDPGAFYPLPQYLAVMDEFQKQFGDGFLQRMGILIFENVVRTNLPEHISNVESALAWIDAAYHANHSNAAGKIGGYHWTTGKDGGLMVCDNPYPCSFDVGVILAVAKGFKPNATLSHVNPENC